MAIIDGVDFDAQDAVDPRMIIGTTGLRHASGFIDEEFLLRLRGRNGVKLYNEMSMNSPTIAAAMNAIKLLVRQVEWRIEPADESDAALEQAEFIRGALFEDMSLPFEDVVSEVLRGELTYGWHYDEIIYKIRRGESADSSLRSKFDDGKWGWRKFDIRAQETLDRWIINPEDSGIEGLVQQDTYNGRGAVFIPIEKALLFRTEIYKGNPEGISPLRPAVISYYDVKRLSETEVIGAVRDLAGMPIFEVPPEVLLPDAPPEMAAMRRQLEVFVTQVARDERWGGLVPSPVKPDGQPSGFDFKLLTTGGKRQIDTDKIIIRKQKDMLKLYMAQFLALGDGGAGSFALSSNMTNLFATATGTIMGGIASVFNRFAIPRLQRLNAAPPELDPKLMHGDIEGPNLEEMGNYLKTLFDTGQPMTDEPLQRKLREIANLPQLELEDIEEGGEDNDTPDENDEDAPLTRKEVMDMIAESARGVSNEPEDRD